MSQDDDASNASTEVVVRIGDSGSLAKSSGANLGNDETMLDTTAPMSTTESTPATAAPWLWAVGLGGALIVGAGLWLGVGSEGSGDDTPQPAATTEVPAPSVRATSVETTSAETTSDPDGALRRAQLTVRPAEATVRVNGSQRPVEDGAVELSGRPGDSFVVELSLQDRKVQRTVVMKRDGETAPASIELPAAAAPLRPRPPPPTTATAEASPPAVEPREGWP